MSVVALGLAAVGCGSADADDAVTMADNYVAVVRQMVEPAVGDALPVVHVVEVGDNDIGLDGQVAVIDELAAEFDVRFADSAEAALDSDSETVAPLDGGILLAIAFPRLLDDPSEQMVVRVERYRSLDDVDAALVTVVDRAGSASVVAVDEVEAEVLGGD